MSKKVHIVFVLDRSGSMESVAQDAAGGFNAFIDSHKALKSNALITLIQFDNEYQVDCQKAKLRDAPVLVVGKNYVPRGSTALLDALGKAITTHETEKLVIVGILTDGQENSSYEHTKASIKKLIERKTKDGWEFHYLSSDLNAFAEAGSLGFVASNTMHVTPDSAGVKAAYSGYTAMSVNYVSRNSK